jgi:hypothetical protein
VRAIKHKTNKTHENVCIGVRLPLRIITIQKIKWKFKQNQYKRVQHTRGAKIIITLYFISRVPCLNFNHVIIINDFHNDFAYYGWSKPKEVKGQKNYNLKKFIYCDVNIYLCKKNVTMYYKMQIYSRNGWNDF